MRHTIVGKLPGTFEIDENAAKSFIVTWLKDKAGLGNFDWVCVEKKQIVRCEEIWGHKVEVVEKSREDASEAQIAAWVVILNTMHDGEFSHKCECRNCSR